MKTLIVSALMALLITGCSVQGELTDLTQVSKTTDVVTSGDFVNAADVFQVDGYTVQSTLGGFTGDTYTEIDGYQVYSNVIATSSADIGLEVRQ